MSKDIGALLVLIAIEVGLYLAGKQFGFQPQLVYIAMGVVAATLIIAWLVIKILAIRRASTIEKSLTASEQAGAGDDTGETAKAGREEMARQFHSYLQALKASPTGKGALATLPWFLVIGAPGSGKTTALQESGLAFSSMGHGVRSIRGIGGTKNCDWWFTDNAIFLDTAGRYTTQPEDQSEWLAFLDLIRETRGSRPLNGILVVVSTAELIRGDASNLAAQVRPVRERIAEVSARLKVVLPVYVVFSKADLMGGFKDFFSPFDRAERDQIWGCTLTAADTAGLGPREAYARQAQRLAQPLSARRMRSVVGDRPRAQVTKACLFPGNFISAQKWFGEFIAELFAPSGTPDQPTFRGFYFTSGIQVNRTGPGAPTPQEQMAAAAAAAPRTEVSFFFSPEQGAPVVEVADNRRGFFLRDLFSKVVVKDRGLASLPAAQQRRTKLVRFLAFYGSIACAALLAIAMVVDVIATHRDIARATAVCAEAVSKAHADPGTQLAALEEERLLLADVGARHSGGARDLERHIQEVYYPQLANLLTNPAMSLMANQLETLRRAPDKTVADTDVLVELLSAYLILGGDPRTPADPNLVEETLRDKGRWYTGLASAGALSADNQRLADRQLAYLCSHLASSSGWQGKLDGALVERAKDAAGDATFIITSFSDAESSSRGGMPELGAAALIGQDDSGNVAEDITISGVYAKDGYDGVFKAILEEKARNLVDKFKVIGKERTLGELRRQLHTIYIRHYAARWQALLAGLRPAPAHDLVEASGRLRALTGADSPYHKLGKSVGEAGSMRIDDAEAHLSFPTDGKWVEDGLTATIALQHAVDDFTSATTAGSRLSDTARIQALAKAADTAATAYDAACGGIDDRATADACRACLGNFTSFVRVAAVTELLGELDRTWQQKVRQPISQGVAASYPMNGTAAQDASIPVFAGIFNPKSGAFWTIVRQVEDLRKIPFGGQPMLQPSSDYVRMLGPAKTMAEALFADGAETMTISPTLTLEPREGVKDLSIAIGAQKFGLYDRPDRRATLTWKQGEAGGAKLSIQLATDAWKTREQPGAGWGILRLLRDAKSEPRAEGGTRLTWSFNDASLNKTYVASIILDPGALGNFLKAPFFAIPDHLSQ